MTATAWILIGFLAGYPILIDDLPDERACRRLARYVVAGFGTGAQMHVECRPRPPRTAKVYE